MVTLDNVVVRRQGKQMLGPASLTLGAGGITAIVGPNGAGKSTLLRVLHGLERVRSGQLEWDVPIDPADQSFVFQTPVFLRRSVRQNLELPLQLRGQKSDVTDLAAEFDLADKMDSLANSLSGGERQRLAMARALTTSPKWLFLDEPSANLDRASTRMIEGAVSRVADAGCRVVFASHSTAQVRRLAQDLVFMEQGKTYGPFSVDDFFEDPPDVAIDWLSGD